MSAKPSLNPATHAATSPTKPAVILAESGDVMTYEELEATAVRVARLLRKRGLRPGDHVAICLDNGPLFLPAVWAAIYSGLTYTPMSYRLRAGEIAYIVNDCGAKAVLMTSAKAREVGGDVVEQCDGVVAWIASGADDVEGFVTLTAELNTLSGEPLGEALAQWEGDEMLYSSGTTGQPKGITKATTPRPMGVPDRGYAFTTGLFGIHTEAVYLAPAPLYHAAPLRFAMAVLRGGGTIILMGHFDAEAALSAIDRYRVTTSQWVPTMFVRMLKLDDSVRTKYDLSSLEYAVHAAAPCPRAVKHQMIDWWGPILHEYYGGTEGNGITYCSSEQWLAHEGTVGRAVVGELHIADAAGEELPAGQEGIVYFAGTPFEYHNDPEKTAQSRDPRGRGWSTLGDIGYVDDDGYLYLTDRLSHMIVSGGVNIYPQEVENHLITHPAVRDVAVIGVPNVEFGEEVKAVVELTEGSASGPELERELIAFCRREIADVKCPRTVDFRKALPREPTGKLLKRVLRDEYWQGTSSRLVVG